MQKNRNKRGNLILPILASCAFIFIAFIVIAMIIVLCQTQTANTIEDETLNQAMMLNEETDDAMAFNNDESISSQPAQKEVPEERQKPLQELEETQEPMPEETQEQSMPKETQEQSTQEEIQETETEPELETQAEEKCTEYTQDDIDLLANIMYAEEGIFLAKYFDEQPSDVEKVFKLCGSVVLHRLENNFMGAASISDVLYASGQYAQRTKKEIENGQDIPDIVFEWAEDLLKDGPLGPNNLVFQAEFIQGEVYAHLWNQYFCTSPYYSEG